MIALSLLVLTFGWSQPTLAKTTDQLYTEIDANGSVIDGNIADIPQDKPIIRPAYMGKNLKEDVTGPDGPFQGFYDETPNSSAEGYYGHEYRIGTNTIMSNLGSYKGREIALKMEFTRDSGNWIFKVNLERNGAIRVKMDYESPVEIQLVYADGQFDKPVENIYVELPLLYRPTNYNSHFATYDTTYIKTNNLKRVYLTTLNYPNITTVVSREMHRFNDTSAKPYQAEALKLIHDNTKSISQINEKIGMTFLFDNKTPLVFYGKGVTSPASYATFFKSDLKTPGEIKYLPPRSKAVKNTDKFEAQFDLTQTLNDGYSQYFPDYLSVVMSDKENKFKLLNLGEVLLTDKMGTDISDSVETLRINHHELEFRVKKQDLIKLGSNQLNITLAAEGLDSQEVLKDFDKEEGVYRVPMTFYNYKSQNEQKIYSEEMIAVANIIPNIYGEAAIGVEASQYTTSGDLDKEKLLKNVATTFPDDSFTTEILDRILKFNEVKTYQVEVKIISNSTKKEKVVSVPVLINKAVIVTSDYFENQEWLINEVNRQLAPKKINFDVYMTDLLKITQIINTDSAVKYTGQHIPKTIASLKNLESLELTSKELAGILPSELGELIKLKKLALSINKIEGETPESLGDLNQLEVLSLFSNKLRGGVPNSLSKLSKLKELTLGDNMLVGQIPLFPVGQLAKYDVSYTQVTFNANETPSFIVGPKDYGMTLIVKNHNNDEYQYTEWALTGENSLSVVVDKTIIKPFDSTNSNFFDLQLMSKSTSQKKELLPEHVYKITSKNSGEVVYEGLAEKNIELVADVGESFEVVMDGAEKNPNNRVMMKGIPRDLSIISTPKNLSLNLTTDNLKNQPVELSNQEALKIRDNRLGGNWQLKVRPSELVSQRQTLQGSYCYINEANQAVEIPVGLYKIVEQGKSNPNAEFIDLTNSWDRHHGLMYKIFQASNYQGNYQGRLDWQLVDAPVISPSRKKNE